MKWINFRLPPPPLPETQLQRPIFLPHSHHIPMKAVGFTAVLSACFAAVFGQVPDRSTSAMVQLYQSFILSVFEKFPPKCIPRCITLFLFYIFVKKNPMFFLETSPVRPRYSSVEGYCWQFCATGSYPTVCNPWPHPQV